MAGVWTVLAAVALLWVSRQAPPGSRPRNRRHRHSACGSNLFCLLSPLLPSCAAMQGCNVGAGWPARQASVAVAVARAQKEAQPRGAAGSSYRSSASSSGLGPFTSNAECDRTPSSPLIVTAKELDLQEQRRCALKQAGSPAGGYLAVCLAVKSECLPACMPAPAGLSSQERVGKLCTG